jgi:vitamin B12 transporter
MNTQLQSVFLAKIAIFVVTLFPITIYAQPQLEEVLVTASRVETPVREVGAAVSIMVQQEIALHGFSSMADLLRTQPGVAVSNAGGAGKPTALRIRGEEGYRTLVLIDGVDVSDPTATQVAPQMHHLASGIDIEKIEILRGPQGFIYGADAGGVVNIITRTAEGFASEFSAEAGGDQTANMQGFVAGGDERWNAFVSVSDRSTDGFNAHVKDEANETDGYQNQTAHAKLGMNFRPGWSTQLVMRSTEGAGAFDQCGFPISDNCADEFSQNIARLSVTHEGKSLTQSMAMANTDTDRSSGAFGQPGFSTDGGIKKIEYLGHYEWNPMLGLVWGGDAENEKITGFDGETDDRDQYGLFAETQTNIADTFYVAAGLRADDSNAFGDHLSARVAPAFIHAVTATSSIKYRASWGTGFRAPSLSEIFYNRSASASEPAKDVILREETSEGYDLGLEWYFDSGYSVQLGYFNQTIENEIFFDLVNYSGYLQENGISHSSGAELAFELPVMPMLSIMGNYTYNETLTNDDQSRIRRPRHLANLGILVNVWSERLQVLGNLRAARGAVNEIFGVGRVPLDDYEVLDLNLHYHPIAILTLTARVQNIADEEYQEVTDYNTQGRTFSAGIKYTFD